MAKTIKPENEQPPPRAGSNREPILVSELRSLHVQYEKAGKERIRLAIEMGKRLNEMKVPIGHGKWGQWIRDNCEFSERSAQLYMLVAAGVAAGFKSAKVADLGIVAYAKAYQEELDIQHLRKAGMFGPRQRKHKPDERRNDFDFRNRKKRRKLRPLRKKLTGELKIPVLRLEQAFRAQWIRRTGELSVAYIWAVLGMAGWPMTHYEWIFLRYNIDGNFTSGSHKTSRRDENKTMTQDALNSEMRELDDEKQFVFPEYDPPEVWDLDPAMMQLLGEWQKSIRIGADQLRVELFKARRAFEAGSEDEGPPKRRGFVPPLRPHIEKASRKRPAAI